ncbi:MAG: endopeptidase La [Deltaproteobacteria bacterium]|nr:endopeptidase La [Deltaproteobacteria bacterium]
MGSPPETPPGEELTILPLRNAVLFPMSVVPINVGRPRTVRVAEDLAGRERALVGVVAQRSADVIEPVFEDLYEVGTLARVVKVIRLGQGNYSVVLNGLGRFRIKEPLGLEPFLRARVERIREPRIADDRLAALGLRLRERTREMLALLPDLPRETAGILDNVREPGALANLIASNFPEEHASVEDRQRVLEAGEPLARVRLVLDLVERQLGLLTAKDRIATQIREEMTRSQHDLVLRQQMKSILDELGESADEDELTLLRERIARAELPPEAEQAAKRQLGRLRRMPPQSAEYNVARTYVDWLADLPWARSTPDQLDVRDVRRCLDEDHHGLERVKKRVVEFSAIRQLRRDKRGPILLFVGPPGVGKTSLGRSIARAMGRRYGRIALGGVRDEAEVRGHRRTYVGALPGRILQALRKVGVKNPVLVLDEIDKMGADLRGDPAAALLEALDPEQNSTFADHYLEVPFDLSQVLFVATANDREGIPAALEDRLEIIEVPGYTRTDKLAIARQFLVPKQLREHGLTEEQLQFPDDGVALMIDAYTREAGVRGLEREIAALCRSVAVRMAEGEDVQGALATPELVERVLGTQRFRPELAERKLSPGVATGIAAGPAGGEILFIEATRMPGKGRIEVTGGLRPVMKESATTAVSLVRGRAERLLLDPEWLRNVDLHLHVPRGAVARDAAGLGLPMFAAVVSLLLEVPTRPEVASIGEVTLRGVLLPVGHVKEKILAAHRAGIREVVLPRRNEPDLEEVPAEIRAEVQLHLVQTIDEVFAHLLDASQAARVRPRPNEPPGGEMHA